MFESRQQQTYVQFFFSFVQKLALCGVTVSWCAHAFDTGVRVRERERERERERDRQTDRQTEKRKRDRERERETETGGERERERERERFNLQLSQARSIAGVAHVACRAWVHAKVHNWS